MWGTLAALFLLVQASGFVADGLKALETGQYETAAEALGKAVAADPSDYSAHFNLALADGFLGRDEDGIAEYRRTLELKPGLYEAELNCGMLMLRRKDAGATALLEAAAEQKPGEFRPRYYLAEAEARAGALDRAEADYRRAIELDAKSAAAESGLGSVLAREGKLDLAAPHYRQAATLDPKYRGLMLDLAGAYEKAHRLAEATAIYRDFGDPAVQARLGQSLIEGKQYAEAVTVLETAYATEPSTTNAVALAKAYVLTVQPAKAAPLLEKAAAADPANFDLRMICGHILQDARQFPAAAAQFAEAGKLKPGSIEAWRQLGDALYMAGDLPRALEAFDKVRQLGENSAGLAFMRAITLDKMHQLKPALEAYQQFLAVSQGKFPDQEFQARQRVRIIRHELEAHR
ncbi:MAG: tetratricopeptide repeat protein [Bryobacteraceae bacterium]|jgi:tetratricopeptide (TPR) repeat protein